MDDFDLDDFNFDDLGDLDGYDSDDFACEEFAANSTDSTSDTIGCESHVAERVKRKRRRKYSEETRLLMLEMHERSKLLRPRILRTDFRRNFAAMCVNVFNSGDYRTVIDYIGTYCTRDVMIQHNDHRPCNGLGLKGTNMVLNGQLCLAKYWYTSMTNCPDVVCNMNNAVVKVRSDGTATVRCNFELRGNVVLSVMNSSTNTTNNFIRSNGSTTIYVDSDVRHDPEIEESTERYLQAKRAVRNALCLKRKRVRKPKVSHLEGGQAHDMQAGVEDEGEEDAEVEPVIPISKERDAQTLPEMRSYVTPNIVAQALDRFNNTNTLTPSQIDSAVHSLLSKPPSEARQFVPGTTGGRFDMQIGEQGQVVLTACCDVVCSYDLEFNAENKVQSLVVNLMR